MNTWIPNNPNQPKKKRKRNKKHEAIPDYLPENVPVAHTTIKGKGHIGRLIDKK